MATVHACSRLFSVMLTSACRVHVYILARRLMYKRGTCSYSRTAEGHLAAEVAKIVTPKQEAPHSKMIYSWLQVDVWNLRYTSWPLPSALPALVLYLCSTIVKKRLNTFAARTVARSSGPDDLSTGVSHHAAPLIPGGMGGKFSLDDTTSVQRPSLALTLGPLQASV